MLSAFAFLSLLQTLAARAAAMQGVGVAGAAASGMLRPAARAGATARAAARHARQRRRGRHTHAPEHQEPLRVARAAHRRAVAARAAGSRRAHARVCARDRAPRHALADGGPHAADARPRAAAGGAACGARRERRAARAGAARRSRAHVQAEAPVHEAHACGGLLVCLGQPGSLCSCHVNWVSSSNTHFAMHLAVGAPATRWTRARMHAQRHAHFPHLPSHLPSQMVDRLRHPWAANYSDALRSAPYAAGELHPIGAARRRAARAAAAQRAPVRSSCRSSAPRPSRPRGPRRPRRPALPCPTPSGEDEMISLARRLRGRFPGLLGRPYFPKRYPIVSTQVGACPRARLLCQRTAVAHSTSASYRVLRLTPPNNAPARPRPSPPGCTRRAERLCVRPRLFRAGRHSDRRPRWQRRQQRRAAHAAAAGRGDHAAQEARRGAALF